MTRSRVLIVAVLLAACETPPQRPVQKPADPDAVNGCTPKPGTLGAMHYYCASYELIDSIGSGTTRSVEADIITGAKRQGYTSSSRAVDVDGVGEALLIEHEEPRGGRVLDMLATVPADSRLVQCHMEWLENAGSKARRQKTCEDAIRTLLARPAPARVEVSAVCHDATRRPTDTTRSSRRPRRHAQCDALVRRGLHGQIAACALSAKSYVETTLCRN